MYSEQELREIAPLLGAIGAAAGRGALKTIAGKSSGVVQRAATSQTGQKAASSLGRVAGRSLGNKLSSRGGRKINTKPERVNLDPGENQQSGGCLLYTSPSPRDRQKSRMPSSA